ncbi:alkaline phosphatase-like [Limulus polyphemus]|uniref:Alkaline phosphatase n=1 Tax=Limulus polyphemus TaxID=6850 RepID=A0ABM1BLQ0_LIMPO|nr:alkaline phosphatase-like [Limulus polyphemus]
MVLKRSIWLICCLLLHQVSQEECASYQKEDVKYWYSLSQRALRDSLALTLNNNVAKNVILFLGDGMSLPTIMAARVLKGQRMGRRGEETWLTWENFPHSCLIKTYNANTQVSDSASTATAYLCGVKNNYETVGVSAAANHSECFTTFGAEVSSILQWAQEEGKDTGFVTTARVTHATPAALYAHSVNRDWESDDKIPYNSTKCKDIARQLVEDVPGRDIKVILGGGRRHFFSNHIMDPEEDQYHLRKDGRDLVTEWTNDKARRHASFAFVTTTKEFQTININKTDYLLGLFSYSHMQYELERNKGPEGEPSIAEMTKTAIKMLQKNSNGYFLLIEGARIDHGHHDTLARHALEETLTLEKAVNEALLMTSRDDTLVIVTADHSQVMTVNGYAKRGTPILGFAGVSNVDNLPYTTLMYTNGPGYSKGGHRANLTGVDTTHKDYQQLSLVPMTEETHGGEDVALYAIGPMAHLFHGVQEQTYVAHAMAYTSCVGHNKEHCQKKPQEQYENCGVKSAFRNTLLAICFVVFFI